MALLTSRAMKDLLSRIMESGGFTEAMEKDLKRLKDDFEEREGILRKYGEVYDGEDKDEYDFTGKTSGDEEEELWRERYEAIRKKYLDRFWGGDEESQKRETREIEKETREDVKRDGTPQTFEDLLEEREG